MPNAPYVYTQVMTTSAHLRGVSFDTQSVSVAIGNSSSLIKIN
jgi:hypothetical protein